MKTLIFILLFSANCYAQSTLTLTALIEGLYNPSTNQMSPDTVNVYLRNDSYAPYRFFDSAKVVLNSSGVAICSFNNISSYPYWQRYRIVLKHRNAVETWSNSISFVNDTVSYSFTTSASRAYRSNQKLKGTRYCIYSGDINQDGYVDMADKMLVDNDLYNFMTGYLSTDLNGDRFTDINDMSIAINNSHAFVRAMVNNDFPIPTIANVRIDGELLPNVCQESNNLGEACFDYINLPVGAVLECDFISTDPDYDDRLWDTAYWSMRDFWNPFYMNATTTFTPPIEHVGPSPLVTHMRLVFHEEFIGYIKWKSYDRIGQWERGVLFFNYWPDTFELNRIKNEY